MGDNPKIEVLEYVLRGVVTLLTVIAVTMLCYNVWHYGSMIKKRLLNFVIYPVIILSLVTNVIDVWFDYIFACSRAGILSAIDEVFVVD